MNQERITRTNRAFVSNVPAAPAAGATVVMFSTHPRPLGGPSRFHHGAGEEEVKINPDSIVQITMMYHLHDQASAANGLRAYQTVDGGVTWEETDMKGYIGGVANQPSIGAAAPVQVPALSSGQEWSEKFMLDGYRGFAIEETAGATGPTPGTGWKTSIAVEFSPQED